MLQGNVFSSFISTMRNALASGGVEFKVKTEDLLAAASDIAVKVDNMKNRINEISEKTAGTSGYWEGEVAEDRRAAFSVCNNNISEALNRLSLYVETLQEISGNYTTAENENVEMVQALPTDVIS